MPGQMKTKQSDLKALQSWLYDYLPASVTIRGELQLSPLSGDAGFRRYFRLNTEPSLMAVYAPPMQEDTPAFVSKALALQEQGIHTPGVFAVDYQRGYLLLEDFGDQLYSNYLNGDADSPLYGAAEQTLLQIQQMAADSAVFPSYDQQLLQSEMALFPEWFVGKLLHLELRPDERQLLSDTFQLLTRSALQQPQVVVHRDYHCRNLIALPNNGVGVIDFQDAVIGAISYDLVSLLKDCYLRRPTDWVTQRTLSYAGQLRDRGLLQDTDDQQFLCWFDWMGLQRHLKVLGIFARLWLRDGKDGYLKDLPLVIRYTLEVTARYPQLEAFGQWFVRRILPALPQHEWYSDCQTAGDVPE